MIRIIVSLVFFCVGVIVLTFGDKNMNIKKGKFLETMDSLTSYEGKFPRLVKVQRILVKTVFGGALIYLSILIFLNKI